ncbi:MAG: VOC family protein [Actinomycetota bacterium]|nr:VOC family protein [Acidimicrobiia bacterium]MDQ3294777.1 VOC family protein [Actinomycetota bacterium]
MGFHHVALASRDLPATHRFYTEACGFELVKAVVAPTDKPGGWAKHVFYDTGTAGDGGLIAFWELHDERMEGKNTAISTGLGFEAWVNHLAFAATDVADLERRRDRWRAHGNDTMQIDHGFCVSTYTMDPNGVLVEWCVDTQPYTQADRDHALAMITATDPGLESPPSPEFFLAKDYVAAAAGV